MRVLEQLFNSKPHENHDEQMIKALQGCAESFSEEYVALTRVPIKMISLPVNGEVFQIKIGDGTTGITFDFNQQLTWAERNIDNPDPSYSKQAQIITSWYRDLESIHSSYKS